MNLKTVGFHFLNPRRARRHLTAMRSGDRPLFLFWALALLSLPATAGLYNVETESGQRTAATGDAVPYDLYLPVLPSGRAAAPSPAVILQHGFGSDKRFHREHAEYMAARGIAVMVPDFVRLFTEESQRRNIENLIDHLAWLTSRTADPADRLFQRIDPDRFGLAGQSAGAAAALEAAIDARARGFNILALTLLDGVPWPRTLERAGELPPVWLSSLRGEPSACNAAGSVLDLLAALSFPVEDVRLIGSSHCDSLNPNKPLCPFLCGAPAPGARMLYTRLLYLFFRDSFGLLEPDLNFQSYSQALDYYEAAHRVSRAPVTPAQP